MLSEVDFCEVCGDGKHDCWILRGTTSGEFYNHAHFEFMENCPVCTPAGRKALEKEQAERQP